MKKSKLVTLVLVSALLASCSKPEMSKKQQKKVHMRSDSTAHYSRMNNYLLWYYAFRPYGYYNQRTGSYSRVGYYSTAISNSANGGMNATKNAMGISRGGFGRSGSVSS